MTTATTSTPAAIAAASASLGRDMLDTIMGKVETLPGWQMASQSTRQKAVEDIKAAVEDSVRQAIHIIGAGSFPACGGNLVNVRFGDNIRATIQIDRSAPGRHALIDMAGHPIVLLMANPDDYMERMRDVAAASAQGQLFPVTDPDAGEAEKGPDYPGVPETDGEVRASLASGADTVTDSENPDAGKQSLGHDDAASSDTAVDSAAQDSPPPTAAAIAILSAATGMAMPDLRVVLAGTLAQIDILVTDADIKELTDAQCRTAYEYAVRIADYPQSAMPRPHFLPDPTPQ